MTNGAFPKLPQTASREEEMQHLEAFLESLESGTYLKSMLTGIGDYCRTQMAKDQALNLMTAYGDALVGAQDTSGRVRHLEHMIQQHETTIRNMTDAMREREGRLESQSRSLAEAYETLTKQGAKLDAKTIETEILRKQNGRLKAALFDLIVLRQDPGTVQESMKKEGF